MADFKDLASLFKHLEQKTNSSLKREVAGAVVKTMQDEIKETVYSVFEPVMYERQYFNDGLLDSDNIEIEILGDNQISVENIRRDGNRNVAEIVETGDGYTYNVPSVLSNGRPFTENTRKRLRGTDILENALRDGLHRQGLEVKK